MSEISDPKHPFFEAFADFTKVDDFTYALDLDEQVVINKCRMTATTVEEDGAGEIIKRQFGLPADSFVLALYLFGEVYRYNARPLDLTAKGNCVYFVHNPGVDHDPITQQDQLVVNRDTVFYHRSNGFEPFRLERFENLTTIANDPGETVESSSLRTGHRTENILLFP